MSRLRASRVRPMAVTVASYSWPPAAEVRRDLRRTSSFPSAFRSLPARCQDHLATWTSVELRHLHRHLVIGRGRARPGMQHHAVRRHQQ